MDDTVTVEVVERRYPDILAFLEEWRGRLRQRRASVPSSPRWGAGDRAVLRIHVPGLDRSFDLPARVTEAGESEALLALEHENSVQDELEFFFQLAGRVMRSLLDSGRFKLVGRGDVAPPRPAPSPPPSPSVPPSPSHGSSQEWISTPPATPAPSPEPSPPLPPVAAVPAPPRSSRLPLLTGTPSLTGTFEGSGLRDAFMSLARDQATGILDMHFDTGIRRMGMFVKGGPVQFLSEPLQEEECLGMMLARAGRVTPEQLQESLQRMNASGMRQGEVFIEMGILTFPTLVMALGKQAELIFRSLATVQEGRFAFYPVEKHAERFLAPAVKVPAILFDALRNYYLRASQQEIVAAQEPLLDQYGAMDLTYPYAELRLKKQEMDLVEILKARSYRMRQMYSVSSMGRSGTVSTVLALKALHLLQFVSNENSLQAEERTTLQLRKKLDFMVKQNHFERLEIHWSARSSDVEKGFERLEKEYETLHTRRRLNAEQEQMRQKILAMLKESYQAIREPAPRQAHRKTEYEPQQCDNAADLLFRQGEMLAVKNQWGAVLENFERAAELQPLNKKYSQAAAQAKDQSYKGSASSEEDE